MISLPTHSRPLPQAAGALLLCLLLHAPAPAQAPQPTPAAQQAADQGGELTLSWPARGAVKRYRLQVARDARFTDIVFDGAVNGLEAKVPLAPGKYYWRVAPAPKETGRYSAPRQVEMTAGGVAPDVTKPVVTKPAVAGIMRPPSNLGWQTATGRIDRPVPARLRAGQPHDLVAVNTDGTVYALEGATGAALWTARYRPARGASGGAPASVFTPVVAQQPGGKAAVLVGYDGGVRLLDGETGDELWRTPFQGRPVSGNSAEMNGDLAAPELVVVTNDPASMYVLDSATGKVTGQSKLDAAPIGPPIPFSEGNDRGVALTLAGAQVEVRQADGGRLRPGVKYDVPFVTPPLVIGGPRGAIIIIGTERGLLFLKGDMKPLGRISTDDDAPRGRLAAADVDANGMPEIVMVTKRGRLALITGDGKIQWAAQGARDAYTAAFADLNRDGVLDVLVADEGVFARGFSGRDGSLIWQVDEEPKSGAGSVGGGETALRALAVRAAEDGTLLVSNDPARGVLRAVGLPAGSVKIAGK